MKKTVTGFVLLLMMFLTGTASGDGLLGKKYFQVGYQSFDLEGANAWGAGVGINIPQTVSADKYSFDLNASLMYLEDDEEGGSVSVQTGAVGLTIYSSDENFADTRFNPYLNFSVGYGEFKVDIPDLIGYQISASIGVELIASDVITIKPFFGYTEVDKLNDGGEAFGIELSIWLSEQSNFAVEYEHASESGIDINGIGIAYRRGF